MNRLFLDTSYVIALSSSKDLYHQRAIQLANIIQEESLRILTTRAVVLEIGNALAKGKYRKAGIELLSAIEEDSSIEIIPISEELYYQALQLFQQRIDKEWGITDCISFIIMKVHALTDALTTDDHFRQAGFKPLLLEK